MYKITTADYICTNLQVSSGALIVAVPDLRAETTALLANDKSLLAEIPDAAKMSVNAI